MKKKKVPVVSLLNLALGVSLVASTGIPAGQGVVELVVTALAGAAILFSAIYHLFLK